MIEVAPGKKTRPVKHLYEAFFYVLVGHGSTTVWLPNGETRSFEWGPQALFAIPLNCQYQIFNNSGVEAGAALLHARRAADASTSITTSISSSTIRARFPIAPARSKHFEGEGDHLAVLRGDGESEPAMCGRRISSTI